MIKLKDILREIEDEVEFDTSSLNSVSGRITKGSKPAKRK